MQDVYKYIEDYNLSRKCNDMISNLIINKKLNQIVNEIFIRGRKLNIYIVSITQSCFPVPKLYTFFIMKISNKRELQQITTNHS